MIADKGIDLIANGLKAGQAPISGDKWAARWQQPTDFFSGSAALPALIGLLIINQDHAHLAVLRSDVESLQLSGVLHGRVDKLSTAIELLDQLD